jgi:cytochrome c peroxidase
MALLLLVVALVIPLGLDLYMPVPEENPLTIEKVELGRRLFDDRRLSRDESTSCATCHDRERAFSTDRPIAVGLLGRVGRRNAPALINRGYGRAFFWDARSSSLEEQVLKPIQDPNEMDLTLDEASSRVGLDSTTMSQALASYVRSILSGDSPYDRFINGDRAALSAEQRAGLQIFRGKGNCTACHVGPNFSDEKLHNTGVAWLALSAASTLRLAQGRPEPGQATTGSGQASSGQTAGFQDEGRFAVSGKPADHGAFKTPTLREVARTAPYLHDGSFATLEDVVEFYDRGGRPNPNLDPEIHPLHLSVEEKRALVAFLQSLSGSVREGQP